MAFLRFLGAILITVGLVSLLAHPIASNLALSYLRSHLSPDGSISAGVTFRLHAFFIFVDIALILTGIFCLQLRKAPFRKKVADILTTRHLGTARPVEVLKWTVPAMVLLCVAFAYYYVSGVAWLAYFFYEDGLFETATALALFASVFFLARSALMLVRQGSRFGRLMTAFLLLLALACLFVGFEEISWGQRIFKWPTPDSISRLNAQNELSIHNMATFTDLFRLLYFLPLFLLVPMFMSWSVHWQARSGLWVVLLPDPGLSGLILGVAAVSLTIQGELLEELVALLLLLYSTQLLGKIRAMIPRWRNG